ncbi:hypothetical protein GGF50DRAFT_121526 [Schizophyllum commune]
MPRSQYNAVSSSTLLFPITNASPTECLTACTSYIMHSLTAPEYYADPGTRSSHPNRRIPGCRHHGPPRLPPLYEFWKLDARRRRPRRVCAHFAILTGARTMKQPQFPLADDR